MIACALLLIFPLAMAFAAANDLFTMKIPNKISLALIAAFALAAIYIGLPMQDAMLHVAVGAGALAVGFIMFSLRLLGGGDAKLMAAGALWMGPEHAILFIAYLTIFGGLLSALILFYRKYVPVTEEAVPGWAARLHVQGTGIPYGIAIAASGLLMYPSTAFYHALQI